MSMGHKIAWAPQHDKQGGATGAWLMQGLDSNECAHAAFVIRVAGGEDEC
jgi:hypothetical protein